ncbi:MAG TPA: helix-turn-helix domain-containing protein [Gemmatimonadaceae bacterium]|nr:helix-turn-helix domain-containing protein [Gemmatimonadaceae bacterium]
MSAPTQSPLSLRDRQAALATHAVFQALVVHLEAGDADDVSMDDLAREAGVSRRTLYRYFPTRADLLAAAGEWIRGELLQLPVEVGDEGIAASFREAAKRLEQRPRLARALLHTATGRAVRGEYRTARAEAIRRALRREVPGLGRSELDRAAGVLGYLCSSSAWIAVQDETGLSASSAQTAVVWAIESLLAQLRAGHTPNRREMHNDVDRS